MNIGRRLKKSHSTAAANRYAIVAAGGVDPGGERSSSQVGGEAPRDDPAAVPDVATVNPPSVEVDAVGATRDGEELEAIDVPIPDGVAMGLEELDPDELSRRRAALDELIAMMRPAVQMDGGDLALVDADYHAGIVEVELQGACGSCAISATTLQGGVERLLKERLEWVTEVHGGVDDSVDPLESAALGRGAYVPRYY